MLNDLEPCGCGKMTHLRADGIPRCATCLVADGDTPYEVLARMPSRALQVATLNALANLGSESVRRERHA